jgi:hypothetical protein
VASVLPAPTAAPLTNVCTAAERGLSRLLAAKTAQASQARGVARKSVTVA